MACLIESELTPGEYMRKLRGYFENPFALWSERFTGITIGPFFSVAYYSEITWKWGRSHIQECNRAFGFVKNADGKAHVHFVYGKGLFSPFWLLYYFVLSFLCGGLPGSWPVDWWWIVCIAVSVCVCGATAFQSALTEKGVEGARILTKLLRKPG